MGQNKKKELLLKEIHLKEKEYEDTLVAIGVIDDENVEREPQMTSHYDHIDSMYEDIESAKKRYREIEVAEENEKAKNESSQFIFNDGHIISDQETDVDYLSRKHYAIAMSKLISKKSTTSPLIIGILGKWGEGKSSFLRLIEKELDYINNNKPLKDKSCMYSKSYLVKFNASEYDERHKIWSSMLKELFVQFEIDKGFGGRVKFLFRKMINSFRQNYWKYIVNFFIFSVFVFWLTYMNRDKNIVDILVENNVYINSIGIVSAILFINNIFIPFIKQQMSVIKPLSDRVISVFELPNYKKRLGFRESVKEDLEDLINVWVDKNKGERVVIFVDELDRCAEETINEFFKALQLFLPMKHIVFICSITIDSVCYALAHNHKYFFSDISKIKSREKLLFGMHYLQKYITLPFYLPYSTSYKGFVDSFINDLDKESMNDDVPNKKNMAIRVGNKTLKDKEEVTFSTMEQQAITECIEKTCKKNRLTPRDIKKLINILILSKNICHDINFKDVNNIVIQFRKYIYWFFFAYFNPLFSKNIARIVKKMYHSDEHMEYKCFNDIKTHSSIISEITKKEGLKDSNIYLMELINEIRVEEVMIFSYISGCFIYEYNE